MKKILTLITLAMLTGCVSVTPEMAARGCTESDAAKLAGMQAGAKMRGGKVAANAEAIYLELQIRCAR